MATGKTTKTDRRLAARCAAIASLGAAVIHFAVTPMHWRDWLPSGVFFALLATFQLVWAAVAWSRPDSWGLAAGIAANAGAAALWVTSCIVGPPVGPSAGQPEPVGAAGICVLLLQCYVVMGAGWAWSRKYRAEEVSGFGRALVLMGANTIMAGAVAVGFVASLQGHHQHHHGGAAEVQGDHHATHDAHMEDHRHPSQPQAPEEQGFPVTDMSLDTDGDHDHSEAATPQLDGAGQPAPDAAAPAVKRAPVQPDPLAGDPNVEADGHQHHHDD